MQKPDHKIGNRLVGRSDYLLITYKLTEFIFRIEARYSAIMQFDFDFLNLEKTTFCVLHFFSYSFTASDGSEGSTAGCVVSPYTIMVHHGIRSKEARHARKQKYRLRQATSHSSLLVASQGDVSHKLNQAFLMVDTFNYNFVDEERSDIYYQHVFSLY